MLQKNKPFKIDLDYNAVRAALIQSIQFATGLDQNHTITAEAEAPNEPRPSLPYFSMKITTPGSRYGDDTKQNVLDKDGNQTSVWNSGGPRKMTVSFDCYAKSHEDAYNLMGLWQGSLDEENIQSFLRAAGISVLIIGTVADLSQLLNTGYEGRAHMDCQFGLAMNLTSDLGVIDTSVIQGAIKTDQGQDVGTNTTVTNQEE